MDVNAVYDACVDFAKEYPNITSYCIDCIEQLLCYFVGKEFKIDLDNSLYKEILTFIRKLAASLSNN